MAVLDVLDDLGVRNQSLTLVERASVNRSRGRAMQVLADPFVYWRCSFELTPAVGMDDAQRQGLMAAIGPRGDGFLVYDTLRPRPVLMDQGVALSDGEGQIAATIDSLNISVTGLPGGFHVVAGDFVEFRASDTVRMLNKVAVEAESAAGSLLLTLHYPLDTETFPNGTIVNFERPSCVMKRIENYDRSSNPAYAQISFSAEEITV